LNFFSFPSLGEKRAREKAQLETVIEAATKRRIEVHADWFPENYSHEPDGAFVSHYGFGGEAKQQGRGN
jgi:hypothetical protein